MEGSDYGYLPSHGIHLSKKMSLKTSKERRTMNESPYAFAIESIMYAMLCIRLVVVYALGVAIIFQAELREEHWKVTNILKYLRRNRYVFQIYSELGLKLEGHTYSSF